MDSLNVEVSVKLIDGDESVSYEYFASCAPREHEILHFDIKKHDILGSYVVRQVVHSIFESKYSKQLHYVAVKAFKVSDVDY